MTRASSWLGLALVPLLLGCASSRLDIAVDVYDDDPIRLAPLNEIQVRNLYDALGTAEVQARLLSEARKQLASELTAAYQSFWYIISRAGDPTYDDQRLAADTEILVRFRDAFQERIVELENDLNKKLAQAGDALTSYLEARLTPFDTVGSPPAETREDLKAQAMARQFQALAAVDEVSLQFIELSRPRDSSFEQYVDGEWRALVEAATLATLQALRDGPPVEEDDKLDEAMLDLHGELEALGRRYEQIRAQGLRTAADVTGKLQWAAGRMTAKPAHLQQAIEAVAEVMTETPATIRLGDRGKTALAELSSSSTLLFSQIDRLQDPGDPVWRIVTHPENEDRWHTAFVETSFYTEGDSSVVVIRDTPMSLRVQRGDTDPTALVRSQLQVTRAISDAAIAIAGASTGVALAPVPGSERQGSQVGDTGVSEAEEIARKAAEIEAGARQRSRAAGALTAALLTVRNQVAARTDPQADAGAVGQLISLLKAYQPVFSTEAGSSDQSTTSEEAE